MLKSIFKTMDSSLPTDNLATALKRAQQEPTILTLRMRTALAMDATGLNALEDSQEQELGDARVEKATARMGKTFEFGMKPLRDRTYTLEELKGALHAHILASSIRGTQYLRSP